MLSHFRHCPVLIFVNLRDFILDFDCYIGIIITDKVIELEDDALFVPVKICEPQPSRTTGDAATVHEPLVANRVQLR